MPCGSTGQANCRLRRDHRLDTRANTSLRCRLQPSPDVLDLVRPSLDPDIVQSAHSKQIVHGLARAMTSVRNVVPDPGYCIDQCLLRVGEIPEFVCVGLYKPPPRPFLKLGVNRPGFPRHF